MTQQDRQKEIIDSFCNIIQYLPEFFDDEVSFTVSDREKLLKFILTEHIHPVMNEGDLLREGSSSYECIKQGKTITLNVPEHVFGVAIRSTAVPIKDDEGNVIGAIAAARSVKRHNDILNLSKNLAQSLEQISNAINHISESVQNIVTANTKILANTQEANEEVKNTDEILNFVKNVANETNLLGLNAAIEAARAGEAGRGFNIVAQEIRKLSNSSSQSINQINGVLKKIQESVSYINQSVNQTNAIFEEQASALEEITASIEELSSIAKSLEDMASKY